jgi:hypothetical protein
MCNPLSPNSEAFPILILWERPLGRDSKDEALVGASWFETVLARLLTMRAEKYQSVIAMARSACRSRADNFSVSDFNWPQAARISRPRGVRTGEE